MRVFIGFFFVLVLLAVTILLQPLKSKNVALRPQPSVQSTVVTQFHNPPVAQAPVSHHLPRS